MKTIDPSIEVGVFLPFSFQTGTTNERHKWILQQSKKIDFIAFQASPNEIIDFKGLVDQNYVWAKDFIKEKTEKLKSYLKSYSYREATLFAYLECHLRKYSLYKWNLFPWCINIE